MMLKRRRSVDPQEPGLATAGIFPVMRRGAFKIKAVAALQMVLLASQRDLQFSAEHEQELLAFVGVGLTAARFWFDSKKMRLHYFVAPGEQFHANAGTTRASDSGSLLRNTSFSCMSA